MHICADKIHDKIYEVKLILWIFIIYI